MTRLEKVVLILALLSIGPALTIRRATGPKEPDPAADRCAADLRKAQAELDIGHYLDARVPATALPTLHGTLAGDDMAGEGNFQFRTAYTAAPLCAATCATTATGIQLRYLVVVP